MGSRALAGLHGLALEGMSAQPVETDEGNCDTGRPERMLTGVSSQAQSPGPASPEWVDSSSLLPSRAEAHMSEIHGHKQSPDTGLESVVSHPTWTAGLCQARALRSPGSPSPEEPPSSGCKVAGGSLARLSRRREARLPFSKFLDEVTVRVLDPVTLEGFRGPQGHSQEPSPGEHSVVPAQEPKAKASEEKDLAQSPPHSLEAKGTRDLGMGSSKQGDPAGSPSMYRASAADMEKLSALQEQKGELRKRLSYTTHKLEKLETEFGSTRHYLEIELRRAQEELDKVTEKLRKIQSNYMALQRINQELEDKLYRMGQHYEEEKRAMNHEIVALNSHLLEAKVTIDKLSEDNELYRKDCNLAAQLLQCSQTYGRVHKVSELPSDFQQRVSLHMEKHDCSLPSSLCHSAYADSVPTCVIAKVLEKPDPGSLSSHLSEASARDLGYRDGMEKSGSRPQYKEDIYCSDTALYCPDEHERQRQRDRRPSVDTSVTDVGFLRAQNSTDSAAEEEEAEAAAFPEAYRHDAFPGYAASLPTSSSYSSFSATSEEKEHAQASTLTASQQAIYLNSRDELFNRKPPSATYGSSSRFGKAAATLASPLEAQVAPGFARTVSPYQAESYRYSPSADSPQTAMPPNLWNLRAKPTGNRFAGGDIRGHWRPLSVEDVGAYNYQAGNAGRASPCNFGERFYGAGRGHGRRGPGRSHSNHAEGRASPLYASYKADSFSEGDDLSQGHLAEPCFLRAGGDLSLSPSRSVDAGYAASEGDGDRLGVQLCGAVSSPEPEHGSRDSLEPSSMEASPEIHPGSRLSPQRAYPRTGGSGLSRKDSLTKAQLYGTLLN